MPDLALASARAYFAEWALAAMQFEPAHWHLCALGEAENPQPDSCIPCGLIRSARALVQEETRAALADAHVQGCGCARPVPFVEGACPVATCRGPQDDYHVGRTDPDCLALRQQVKS